MRKSGSKKTDTARNPARGRNLEDDLDLLLGELCVSWGFCNGLSGADVIADQESVAPEHFAIAVLTAEGFPEPVLEIEWSRRLKRRFVERYGGSVSAASYSTSGGG